MAFKKPIDSFEKYSKKEREEKLEEFRENFDEEDEKALISAALKTFMPAVLIVCGIFALIGILLRLWLS